MGTIEPLAGFRLGFPRTPEVLANAPAIHIQPSGGCYEIENAKREKLGDFADFETNQLAFG
jgi:hypothetical protein